MRELKFRAYSKNLGMSRPAEFAELLGEPRTDFYEFDVYMQYTGLKDRHGVEIYEGDVVCAKALTPHLLTVKWSEANAGLMLVGLHFSGDFEAWFGFGHNVGMEVIGNIYENPELLEKQ